MNVLAYDSSGQQIVMILEFEGKCVSHVTTVTRQKLNVFPILLNRLLGSVSAHLDQLDFLAVGLGPGSFTGIRIATGFTQGLVFGLGCNLVCFSSLHAMAQTIYDTAPGDTQDLKLIMDARMQQAYVGKYHVDPNGIMQAIKPDYLSALSELTLENAYQIFDLNPIQIFPESLLKIAKDRFIKGHRTAPECCIPNYLKEKVTQ